MGITGINTMQAMISASSAMAQVQRQDSVVVNMKGREGVLESEIKLDIARGANVEKKQEELEEVQKKFAQVQSTQMDTLTDANKKLEEARKADQKAEIEAKKKADKKKAAEDKKDKAEVQNADKKEFAINKEEDKNVSDEGKYEFENIDVVIEMVETDISNNVNVSVQEGISYSHVDVRL